MLFNKLFLLFYSFFTEGNFSFCKSISWELLSDKY